MSAVRFAGEWSELMIDPAYVVALNRFDDGPNPQTLVYLTSGTQLLICEPVADVAAALGPPWGETPYRLALTIDEARDLQLCLIAVEEDDLRHMGREATALLKTVRRQLTLQLGASKGTVTS